MKVVGIGEGGGGMWLFPLLQAEKASRTKESCKKLAIIDKEKEKPNKHLIACVC